MAKTQQDSVHPRGGLFRNPGIKDRKMKSFISRLLMMALIIFGIHSAFAERKELGALDRGGVEGILKQFGYGWLSVESAYREDEDDKKDGAGYKITAKCKNKDKVTYDAVLWVTKRWDKGRVISAKTKSARRDQPFRKSHRQAITSRSR